MPKDFTRVNVTSYTGPALDWGTGPTTWYAVVEEWRSYITGARWEWIYTIAHADSEAEVRKKAAELLREWAGELEAVPKKRKPLKLKMPRGWNKPDGCEET